MAGFLAVGTLDFGLKTPIFSHRLQCTMQGNCKPKATNDLVLLRWKLDDGKYRVIFGNLRLEDVSADRLAKLEVE